MDTYSTAPRPPNWHPSQSQTAYLESEATIPPTRNMLETWLANEVPSMDDLRRYEIVLAANELLCNAFEHGTGGCVFDMQCADDQLKLTVSNRLDDADEHVAPTGEWAMPGIESCSGRGLPIVKSVADTVKLETTGGTVSIAASFDLAPRTHTQTSLGATLVL